MPRLPARTTPPLPRLRHARTHVAHHLRSLRPHPEAWCGPVKKHATATLTPEQRRARTHDALTRIDRAVAGITDAAAFRPLLRAMARLARYSAGNQILIYCQNDSATAVAGFKTWLAQGRSVRKGEKGIMILKPITIGTEDDDTGERTRRVVTFGPTFVFDVSQTQPIAGIDPAPELARALHCPILDGEDSGLYQQLRDVARRAGLTVSEPHTLSGALMGYYDPARSTIAVRTDTSPLQMAKTLAHELAHHLHHSLADGAHCDTDTREAVAEATAFIVLDAAGLDSSLRSVPYIAGWAHDSKRFRAALDTIRLCSATMIRALEQREHDEEQPR